MKNFSVMAESIIIKFDCNQCGCEIEETLDELPVADMSADNVAESENSDQVEVICPECDREYTIDLYRNMYEGNVEIEGVDDFEIEEQLEE